MGKKANERRKKIMVEVLGELPSAKRKPRVRAAPKKLVESGCCYDKYDELPTNFRTCYGCPKEARTN